MASGDPKLDLLLAQESQKKLSELEQGLMNAFRTCEIIDHNMKQAFMSIMADMSQMTLRINFFLKIFKELYPQRDFENEFKEFVKSEAPKMQKAIDDRIREANKKVSEGKENVIRSK